MADRSSSSAAAPRRVLILGAAGRDFHEFHRRYRDDATRDVVAFTAAQIPGIAGRRYPASLAGPRYPQGIPILDEEMLESQIATHAVDEVVLAYSDLPHGTVMHLASRALAAGADFVLPAPRRSMIDARVPVIAVSAVRTGTGKSPVARWIAARLRAFGLAVAVVRHPMPYGDLESMAVQRFASLADLDAAHCTIEEREEYEPHIAAGGVVWAGVDYRQIVEAAAAECDVLLWDGGNNDLPFVIPDLHVVLADALRPGDESAYHPGETCLRTADVIVLSKSDRAEPAVIERLRANCRAASPRARLYRGRLAISFPRAGAVRGRRVLVIEDGPTLTHGGMAYGAGLIAAREAGALIVDPRPVAAPAIAEAFRRYPHIGPVLPALGYSAGEIEALRETVGRSAAEFVVAATPIDLARDTAIARPVLRVGYGYEDLDSPGLGDEVDRFVQVLPARGRVSQ